MQFLVTGATGLVGSTLTRALVERGFSVRILRRSGSAMELLADVSDRIEVADGDITDPVSLDDAFDGVTHVFHCAAWVGFPGRGSAERMHAINVTGTANIVNAAIAAGVKRLVHLSSVAALGRPESEDGCLDESATWTESRFNTVYGHSKYLSELEVQRGIAEGLDAVIANPSVVFGRGRSGENTWRIVEAVKSGRVAGYPVGGTNVIDAEDLAVGLMLAMERGLTGQRYVFAGPLLAWKDILTSLSEAFGRQAPRRRVPLPIMMIVATLAETFSHLRGQTPGLTRQSARVSARSTCFDSARARSELGWTSRPFADTARRLADIARSVEDHASGRHDRNRIPVALLLSLGLLVGACGGQRSGGAGAQQAEGGARETDSGRLADGVARPVIVTTFHAIARLVSPLVGERADVVALLEPGVSPHAFEPSASDARRLGRALVTVHASESLDAWAIDLGGPRPVSLWSLVPDSLRRSLDGRPDPHVWLSPLAMSVAVGGLADHLCLADVRNCDEYRSRAAAFKDTLRVLDRRIADLMRPTRADSIVISSPFLTYFVDRYGPPVSAVVEAVEGVEPSPVQLRRSIDAARRSRAVVGQPWLPEVASRAVSEAAGVPFVVVDPIGGPGTAGSYQDLLLAIAHDLLEATGHE